LKIGNPHDPDDVLRFARLGQRFVCDGWNMLHWVAMNDRRFANRCLAGLGLNPILLNGLLDDGGCTCGRADCDKSRGKHPAHKNWQTAPLNVDGIDQALLRNWRCNIGIRTGLQPCGRGLVVIDVDGPRELLEPLEAQAGEAFPPTLTARTGSGGLHLFYWLREGVEVRNTQGLVPNVDIRGYGGQVVVAPSLHLSGNKYTWIDVREPAVLP
jgi:putative DNA primase/helicase